ncbi:MAG TPA: hypothetical protein PLO98_01250 [Bacteroidia bacterium]|nr:hypothetical protein [Bacteroidia bacterium]
MSGKFEQLFDTAIFVKHQYVLGENMLMYRCYLQVNDDRVRMNDRNKHKVTGQMNHQTANPKANASVFLFFHTAHFLKTILPNTHADPLAKPKDPFFANAPRTIYSTIIN